MSVTKIAFNALGAAVAAAILSTTALAQSLHINDGPAAGILTPPGFTYSSSGATSVLDVTTEGFVICANAGQFSQTPVSLRAHHDHWAMPTANDVPKIGYTGNELFVNKGVATFTPENTLACQVRGPEGEVSTPFSGSGDELFRDSWESFSAVQFSNLVNWQATSGFTWDSPDWTVVPNDSCSWDLDPNSPQVVESSVCAAATGVRPIAVSSQNDPRYGDRAPTMWTTTTANNFVYLARVDARFGPQDGPPNSHFPPDPPQQPNQAQASSVDVVIRDAYDSNYLGPNGTYCLLRKLPATLTENVCASSDVYFSQTLLGGTNPGFVDEHIPLLVGFNPAASLYIAVVRQKLPNGTSAGSCQPYSAIATMIEPGVSRSENGDEFIGDNVVFGFRNADSFEWMGCIP